MQCLLSLWHSMIFTWVNSWVSCFCSKIVFENLVQEEILIRYISLAAIFLLKHSFFRMFNWPQREITEPDVKYFPKMTSRISKNVQHNLIYRMSNEQGGFKNFVGEKLQSYTRQAAPCNVVHCRPKLSKVEIVSRRQESCARESSTYW